mgnify:CR=1 FL=1
MSDNFVVKTFKANDMLQQKSSNANLDHTQRVFAVQDLPKQPIKVNTPLKSMVRESCALVPNNFSQLYDGKNFIYLHLIYTVTFKFETKETKDQ